MSRDYMGQVTDRDIEMVNLLIENPILSLDELGSRLGVTKQAVAERKAKLEQMGFTKSFYFWNMTPRFEGTKRVLIEIERDFTQIDQVLEVLDRFNPIVVFFRTDPESFFSGEFSSLTGTISQVEGILHLNDGEEEKQLRLKLEKLNPRQVSIESVLFSRLLGEKCDITLRTPEGVENIAKGVAQQLASEASVQAVLYEEHGHPVDQFDLIIVRDERFQPKLDSYERRVEQMLIDYHFTNMRCFLKSESYGWLKSMKIIYAQDEATRRKIQRKINSVQTEVL